MDMDITIVHRQSLGITQVMEVMEDHRIQDLPLLHQDQVEDITQAQADQVEDTTQVQANQVVAVVDDKKIIIFFETIKHIGGFFP